MVQFLTGRSPVSWRIIACLECVPDLKVYFLQGGFKCAWRGCISCGSYCYVRDRSKRRESA